MYITTSELKNLTIIEDIKNCTNDIKLQRLIDYCESLINSYVGFEFKSETKTIYLDGNGESTIVCPDRIISLTSLKVNNEEINLADTKILSNKIISYTKGTFNIGVNNIQVIGTFGWQSVPNDIKLCVITLCEQYFSNIDNVGHISSRVSPFKSEKIGNYSYELRQEKNSISELDTTGDKNIDLILSKYTNSFDIGVI